MSKRTRVIQTARGPCSLRKFIDGVKIAIANPDEEFQSGLTTWWPTTGAEIRKQFRESIHDRINQAIPYHQRGIN